MKRLFSILAALLVLFAALFSAASADTPLYGLAIEKLATRTGPGTSYEGGGTYSVKGEYIHVISRAYDKSNGIWWVKCEIPYHGEMRILWTGYKRFDPNSLPLESIPIEGEEPTAAPQAAPVGGDWQSAYRQFISSNQYDQYIRNPNNEYNGMLLSRDRQWDSFLLHDIDGNGVPELLVWTSYGIEQADVFTWNGNNVVWTGRMGGENFFQGFFRYPDYMQAGLVTAEGGPAMEFRAYTLSGTQLVAQEVGRSTVDSEGTDTTGIVMYNGDTLLFQQLYATFMYGDLSAMLDGWCVLSSLQDGYWQDLFR